MVKIKCENTSAISSEAVDCEYSVKNPLVSLYVLRFNLLEQVEHFAYLKSLLLKLVHSTSSKSFFVCPTSRGPVFPNKHS